MFFSTLFGIVEALRIDLQHGDDNVEVHFVTGGAPLPQLHESQRVAELRVPERTRK